MAFKLSLVALVYPNAAGDSGLNIDLLQRANAWLQRRNSGMQDELLLIGAGFEDESALQAMLKPYGLANVEIAAIPPNEFDESDATELGEAVELIAERWISKGQSHAIPVVQWNELISDAAYPADGWWWAGLEAADDEQSSLASILAELLPDAFNKQALTWATLIAECDGLNCAGEEHEVHEAAMQTIALARWLTGFDAASENNFYDFSAAEAIDAAGLDPLRLGFEAGRNHESALGDYFEGNDVAYEGLADACLLACLEERTGGIKATLSSAFGGDPLLFWSLYRSIWPDLKRSSDDNMNRLLSLHEVEMGDLERPWLFVTEGWTDFAEE